MKKSKVSYICKNCGYTSAKWMGRCPNCGEWGTFEEISNTPTAKSISHKKPVKLATVESLQSELKFNGEFSKIFLRKLTKGGVYLISGTPGVGKSTFLLQLAKDISNSKNRVIYISAEESLSQIAQRAKRLSAEDIEAITTNKIDEIVSLIESEKPDVAIIDSIHTVFDDSLDYVIGGIQQVKHCSEKLIDAAKRLSVAIFVVAHITKGGVIAGPKTLEHMVDVVLMMEGDKNTNLRVLKFTKNRFGPTDEALILEMREDGLKEVKDPTLKFVKIEKPVDGVAYGAVLEGRIPIVLEVEALCVETPLGIPRRVSVGFDLNRLHMLLAVLEKRLNMPLFKYDVYVNVAGGIKASSTLFDAAVCCAVISSFKRRALKEKTVVLSEVDLSGNLRLFEKDISVIQKLEELGFNVFSALNVKNIKGLYEMI
ncbi:ATPase domain-containing protein [Hippea alviniae]|uniref:ATPase domain-containing protein n=1 Tax=Hippea alviniae TaxID=1279027 RepID=UPI00047A6F8D|nr:ATPase domain-containing protein [Hippea alviniae]